MKLPKRIDATLISLVVAALSLVIGVLNWKLAGVDNFAGYLALFGLSFSLVLIPAVGFFFTRTAELEKALRSMISGSDVEGVADKRKLTKRLIGESVAIEAFGDSDLLIDISSVTGVTIPNDRRLTVYGCDTPPKTRASWDARTFVCRNQPAMQAVFFVSSDQVASEAVLIPSGTNASSVSGWVHLANVAIVQRMRDAYARVYANKALDLATSSATAFSAETAEQFLTSQEVKWSKSVAEHHRLCEYGRRVSAVQAELTTQATDVKAMDMSSLEIWLPEGRAKRVVDENRVIVDRGGTVRRIFVVDSEAHLKSNPEYLSLLCRVLEIQRDVGVVCGVVFRDQLPLNDVEDFALYRSNDAEIVWVETLQSGGTVGTSSGYFSSKQSDIERYDMLFDRIWTDFQPEQDARKLLGVDDKGSESTEEEGNE